MVTIGADSHKRTHTLVAVDELGRELGATIVKATSAGHLELVRWAGQWPSRRFALEDCRGLSRRLEQDLLVAGERVLRVPPKLMAGARRSSREPGKSDPIDALAVARAALREPDLPVARLDGPEREVRLLVDHREDLLAERTRLVNRVRWHLHELMPGQEPPPRTLHRPTVTAVLELRLGGIESTVARIAAEDLRLIRVLTGRIDALAVEIGCLARRLGPSLLELLGCSGLTTGKIVGETAGVERFRSGAAFARHNGTAPVPVWSGNTTRHRLSRGGNRQLNAALHRIALTQIRFDCPGRDYYRRRISEGATKTEALRLLRRQLSNEVYRRLCIDAAARHAGSSQVPDAA